MKSLFLTLGKITIFLLVFSSANVVSAAAPTYVLKVANESQPSPNTYEFDVFLLNTSSTPLELQTFQFGLGYDLEALDGGVPTYSIVNVIDGNPTLPASSELNTAQIPTTLPADKNVVTNYSYNGVNYRYFNCATKTPPGAGNGSIISNVDGGCNHPGTRIARFRITNSVPFKTNSTFKHIWSVAPGFNRTKTIVQAYVNGTAVNITTDASNVKYDQNGSCNPLLINATTGITTIKNENLNSFVAYPNPTTGKATITFNSDRSGKYTLRVVDMIGRVMTNEIISAVEGFNMKEINLADVAKGIYLVSVQTEGNEVQTLRLVVE